MMNFLKNRIINPLSLCVILSAFLFLLGFFQPQLVEAQTNAVTQKVTETVLGSIGNAFFNSVGYVFLEISAMFTRLGGLAFEKALSVTVFEMGSRANSSALTIVWSLIRDICNLAFIFGFIYVGIRTIIDPESADTKRFLSRIIIGALLINFSLFFAKAVIDFSNFTAYQIYIGMADVQQNGSITSTVMNQLRLVTWYNPATGALSLGKENTLGFFIMAGIFLLITAFTFLAGALLLVIRFVALILIMIASPLLFAATVFPQTESIASELWRKLISYSFFAPVYLLLVLISIKLIDGINLGQKADFGKDIGSLGANFDAVLNFTVIIFFMISALTIASRLGVAGGDVAVKFAGGLSFGLAAKMGRGTIGRLAHSISEKDGLKDAAAKKGIGGWAARQALKSSRLVGDSSFDMRNAPGIKSIPGVNFGEGRKGGYTTVLGEVEKKEKEFAQSLGEIGDDDVRVQARKKEMGRLEKNKRDLEEQISAAQNANEKIRLRERLEKTKKDIEDKKIEYEKEKQRRIIGSTYSRPENPGLAAQLKEEIYGPNGNDGLEAALKDCWDAYLDIPNDQEEQKEAQREILQNFMKNLEDKKKEYAKVMRGNDDGYAGVLETSDLFTAWPAGRMVVHENEAGEAIRKSAEKGLPKKKDD